MSIPGLPPLPIMRRANALVRRLYRLGLGRLAGHLILLLTTTGRRSGQPRVTPLQYERIGSDYYVAAAAGEKADWFRNLRANPKVMLQIRSQRFPATAEAVTDPVAIAGFLALRLQRHPHMVGRILRAAGLPPEPTRGDLERYAAGLAMAILHPENRPPETHPVARVG